jgi:prolyl-tRNA synthetase
MELAKSIEKDLKTCQFEDIRVYTELDDRDLTSSERNWYWIKKGIPLRIEIGPRDVASGAVMVARRDLEPRDKCSVPVGELKDYIIKTLSEMQGLIYAKALKFRDDNIVKIDDNKEFYSFFTPKNQAEIHGGFASSPWCGSVACEEKIKDDLKVTVRCIPFEGQHEDGNCVCCGAASKLRVIFAKSY